MTKAAYVRSQTDNPGGRHHCHWPGCDKAVPPAMWGCRAHWYALPREIQLRIWSSYRPGQEISKTPSRDYILDAEAAQAWVQQHLAAKRAKDAAAQQQQPLL